MHPTSSTRSALLGFFALALCAAGCRAAQADPPPPAQPPFATPPVLAGSADVATLVTKVKPAVVNITTVHEMKMPRLPFPFGFELRPRDGDNVIRQQALGSGFLIDTQGHVVTNAHVVDEADVVKVRLADEREFEAKVKGRDRRLDIAVLELQGAKDLPAASLGSSDALRVGEYVVAIGNPFGLGNTVTMGIVSAKGREIGAGPYDDFIQTDASINPGNSGGPLFDLKGEVVGINTAINPAGRGIGFAIPVDALKDVLPQLLQTGHVERGHLGVGVQSIDRALAKALGLDRPQGALVGEVQKGGPAEKAGVAPGDVIVAVDGAPIDHSQDLPRAIARHAPGTHVKLDVVRDKAKRSFEVVLDRLPEEEARSSEPPSAPSAGGYGLSLSDSPDGNGAVVERVAPASAAEDELRPGDVILQVNKKPVSRASDASKLLREVPRGEAALLEIRRGDSKRFVALVKPRTGP